MKKLATSFFVFLLLIQTIKAQTTSNTAVNKGNIFITSCIGSPNFLTRRIIGAYKLTDRNVDQLITKSTIPVCVIASYQITDNLAFGGEVSYESTKIKWRENETLTGNDSTVIPIINEYGLDAMRIRVLAVINYHFAIKKRSDWYFGFGLGYSHNTSKLTSETPHTFYKNVPSCFLPISTRTKVGINYYFTENMAFNAEVGIGGPLASVGITVKL